MAWMMWEVYKEEERMRDKHWWKLHLSNDMVDTINKKNILKDDI